MKNKTTAALLAFFLGGIGVQYFYLGKSIKGLLCILFCWTFIPCLIALVHVVYYLTVSDAVFNATYNRHSVRTGHSASVTPPAPAPIPAPRALPVISLPAPQPIIPPAAKSSMAPIAPSIRRARQQPEVVSKADELQNLFLLREKGTLTENEYLVEKARLLL